MIDFRENIKEVHSMRNVNLAPTVLTIIFCAFMVSNLQAQSQFPDVAAVPNSFVGGQVASADEVNENFGFNSDRINRLVGYVSLLGSWITQVQSASDFDPTGPWFSEVVSATCPSDSIMLSGTISCSTNNSDYQTTNYGAVFRQGLSGNLFVGYCIALEGIAFDVNKYGPPIEVEVRCLYERNSQVVGDSLDSGGDVAQAASPSSSEPLYADSKRPLTEEEQKMLDRFTAQRAKLIKQFSDK
jgi:hypothetical protein